MRLKFEETNSKVIKRKRLNKVLSCRFCPPNGGENAKRRAKHGATKPRYKDKR